MSDEHDIEEFSDRDYALAARIRKQPQQLAPLVLQTLDITECDSPEQNELMGNLKFQRVTRKEFEDFFIKLCIGLQHQYEITGVTADKMAMLDEWRTRDHQIHVDAAYFPDEDILLVTRKGIAEHCERKRNGITSTMPLMRDVTFSADQRVMMLGVEEGSHIADFKVPEMLEEMTAHQEKLDAEYAGNPIDPSVHTTDDYYARDASEVRAVQAKREACKIFNFNSPDSTSRNRAR